MAQESQYPNRIEGGNYDGAILVGVNVDGPEYYDVALHAMVKPGRVVYDGDFGWQVSQMSEWRLGDDESVGEHIIITEREYAGYSSFSDFGKFMRNAAPFNGVRILTGQQSLVYGLREIVGLNRNKIGSMMDISPNTVDNVNRTAKNKVESAFNLVEALNGE